MDMQVGDFVNAVLTLGSPIVKITEIDMDRLYPIKASNPYYDNYRLCKKECKRVTLADILNCYNPKYKSFFKEAVLYLLKKI